MIVRQTLPQEQQRVDELFGIAFEFPMQPQPEQPPQPRTGDRVTVWAAFTDDTDEMMSNIQVKTFDFRFDGAACKMGGIGGVASLPQYRRQGCIRACFAKALPHMYENGFDFSYLYPFSTAFYRQFGYETCVRKYQFSLRLSMLRPQALSGSLMLAEAAHPMVREIQTVDRIWEQKYGMMTLRREEDYRHFEHPQPAVDQHFTYVYRDRNGTPKAYTTIHKEDQSDGRNLVADRFCFADAEGFSGLMELFRRLSADHVFAKFQTPEDPGLLYLLPEWALGAVSWGLIPCGMVRVVNVQSVLKKAAYHGSGSLCLQIRDGMIPQNNGTFRVTFRDGAALAVEPADGAPDAVMDISAFSALISGVCEFKAVAPCLRGLEIRNPYACFSQVFYRKPMMITEGF